MRTYNRPKMDRETILAAMRHCAAASNCMDCPAYRRKTGCLDAHAGAADLIEQQQRRIEDLEAELTENGGKAP